jgi:predicted nuclease of predicted toxin-antitoxin system
VNPIKFYLDEDVDVRLASALRGKGFDAITTRDAEKLTASDSEQLAFATLNKKTIITSNVSDYAKLHSEYQKLKKMHGGIIVTVQQIPVGEILRRLTNLTAKLSADDMINRLEYLSSWR